MYQRNGIDSSCGSPALHQVCPNKWNGMLNRIEPYLGQGCCTVLLYHLGQITLHCLNEEGAGANMEATDRNLLRPFILLIVGEIQQHPTTTLRCHPALGVARWLTPVNINLQIRVTVGSTSSRGPGHHHHLCLGIRSICLPNL